MQALGLPPMAAAHTHEESTVLCSALSGFRRSFRAVPGVYQRADVVAHDDAFGF